MATRHEPIDQDAALRGLARQVDGLQGQLATQGDEITNVQKALRTITDALTDLSRRSIREAGRGRSAPADTEPSPEWLTITNEDVAVVVLDDLGWWLPNVWNHYGVVPSPCWPYHPAAVAELVACRSAWLDAIAESAKPNALADWHERYRRPLADRIPKYITCAAAAGGHEGPDGARYTASEVDLPKVAAWWAATHGQTDDPAPGLSRVGRAR